MSDDLISRADAIEAVETTPFEDYGDYITTRELIESLPSADRPKGEWILECDAEGHGDNLYRCPKCGNRYGCQEYDKPNYCLECGADLRGKGNERER